MDGLVFSCIPPCPDRSSPRRKPVSSRGAPPRKPGPLSPRRKPGSSALPVAVPHFRIPHSPFPSWLPGQPAPAQAGVASSLANPNPFTHQHLRPTNSTTLSSARLSMEIARTSGRFSGLSPRPSASQASRLRLVARGDLGLRASARFNGLSRPAVRKELAL